MRASIKLISDRYVCPNLNRDIRVWSQSPIPCQGRKVRPHAQSSPPQISTDNTSFAHVKLDIVGSFPLADRYRFLLAHVDHCTCWSMAVSLTDTTSETVFKSFLHPLISTFDAPPTITTDWGAQSELNYSLISSSYLKLNRLAWGHDPSSNGLLKRLHRQLETSLASNSHVDHVIHLHQFKWRIYLPSVYDLWHNSEAIWSVLPWPFRCYLPVNVCQSFSGTWKHLGPCLSVTLFVPFTS